MGDSCFVDVVFLLLFYYFVAVNVLFLMFVVVDVLLFFNYGCH
jgi:hypothetical protein